jgi:hypothetical protein
MLWIGFGSGFTWVQKDKNVTIEKNKLRFDVLDVLFWRSEDFSCSFWSKNSISTVNFSILIIKSLDLYSQKSFGPNLGSVNMDPLNRFFWSIN